MQTILIAEDEKDIRQLVSFNLERESFSTISSGDGKTALSLARSNIPDLIILDLMLPVMDGFEVFKELRLDSRTKDIPVIMLTAKAQLDDIIAGLEMGADDYLTKPFSPKELMLRVKALLKRVKTSTGSTILNLLKLD